MADANFIVTNTNEWPVLPMQLKKRMIDPASDDFPDLKTGSNCAQKRPWYTANTREITVFDYDTNCKREKTDEYQGICWRQCFDYKVYNVHL